MAIKPKIISGAWWDSEKPDYRWQGDLHVNEHGSSHLELKTIALKDVNELPEIEAGFQNRTFHGHDEHGRVYSLFGCVQAGSSKSTAQVTRTRSVRCVVAGVRVNRLDDVTFDEVWLDFSDLQEWLCTPLLTEQHPPVPGKILLNRMPDEPRVFPTDRGYELRLTPVIGGGSSLSSVTLKQEQQLSLRFQQPTSLRALQPLVLELQWLISLGRGEPVQVLKVDGLQKEVTRRDVKFPETIEVWAGWSGAEMDTKPQNRYEMLFTADDLGQQLGPMFERWHDYRENHAAVLSSYFSTRFNRHLYSNQHFLFLAHALELYHQINFDGANQPAEEFSARVERIAQAVPAESEWIRQRLAGANRKTLADRLHQLLEAKSALFGNLVADRKEFVSLVRDTRNYYTHYDESLRQRGRVADGVVLMKLSNQMRAMLEALFLDDLGAPTPAISRVLFDRRTYLPAP